MDTTKKLGRGASSGLLKLSILLLALFLPIILVFGQAKNIKSTLASSGIYSTAVDSALDSAQKESNNNQTDPNQPPNNNQTNNDGGLPFDDPQVRAVVKQAVPPSQIQQWAEQLIDSGYGWLDGTTEQPVINVDFSQVKQKLAVGLGNYAVNRAKTLPVCTTAELQALQAQGDSPDPFKLTCVPPGFDVQSLQSEVEQQVLSNADFLQKDSFTTADIPKDQNTGETVFQKVDSARTAYKWAKATPYIWAGLAILFAVLLFLLHDDRRRGAFVVGRTFTGVGIFVTVVALISRFMTIQATNASGPLAKQIQGNFQDTVLYIAKSLALSLNNVYLIIGLVYVLIGAGILVALRLTRPKVPATVKKK